MLCWQSKCFLINKNCLFQVSQFNWIYRLKSKQTCFSWADHFQNDIHFIQRVHRWKAFFMSNLTCWLRVDSAFMLQLHILNISLFSFSFSESFSNATQEANLARLQNWPRWRVCQMCKFSKCLPPFQSIGQACQKEFEVVWRQLHQRCGSRDFLCHSVRCSHHFLWLPSRLHGQRERSVFTVTGGSGNHAFLVLCCRNLRLFRLRGSWCITFQRELKRVVYMKRIDHLELWFCWDAIATEESELPHTIFLRVRFRKVSF